MLIISKCLISSQLLHSWLLTVLLEYIFVNSWNHHPIRTAHNKSPQQLFSSELLLLHNSGLTALDLFEDVDSAYGIDYDAPIPSQDDKNGIEVPECAYINDADLTSLKLVIDPLQQSNEYGIDIYENTV